ncbi:RuBisCO large subunit-binding protein subunit beta, chloroplastic [Capsicum chinense]|nr:RuBisCO large subunit-binding protein subunit beta, chloroplastic [Capsicum chinense]
MHSGTVIRKEVGLSLEKAGSEVLGNAAKVVLAKESTTIVGDGSTKDAVSKIIGQLKRLSRGADIVKRALRYPMKLIANNAGVNGSVVIKKAPDLLFHHFVA